jgi:hypothetical protein
MGYSLEAVASATDSIPNYLKSFFKFYCQPTVLSKHFVCPVELRGCVVRESGRVKDSKPYCQTFLFEMSRTHNRVNSTSMTRDQNGGLQNPPVIKLSTAFANEKF